MDKVKYKMSFEEIKEKVQLFLPKFENYKDNSRLESLYNESGAVEINQAYYEENDEIVQVGELWCYEFLGRWNWIVVGCDKVARTTWNEVS